MIHQLAILLSCCLAALSAPTASSQVCTPVQYEAYQIGRVAVSPPGQSSTILGLRQRQYVDSGKKLTAYYQTLSTKIISYDQIIIIDSANVSIHH